MKIQFISTGGTIDKVYFDAKSTFEVGDPQVFQLLQDANISFDYEITPLMSKDSLDMTDKDREKIRAAVAASDSEYIIITHGTDTMVETAKKLADIPGKTIVLTGSMQPARFRVTDAVFNIGFATAAVQSLPGGVYIAVNGLIFNPETTRKNVEENRFESVL